MTLLGAYLILIEVVQEVEEQKAGAAEATNQRNSADAEPTTQPEADNKCIHGLTHKKTSAHGRVSLDDE